MGQVKVAIIPRSRGFEPLPNYSVMYSGVIRSATDPILKKIVEMIGPVNNLIALNASDGHSYIYAPKTMPSHLQFKEVDAWT